MPKTRICSIDGCGKKHIGLGYCSPHYRKLKKYGNPLAGKEGTVPGQPRMFLEEVVLNHTADECLAWPFGRDGKGRGVIQWNGRQEQVHRVICIMLHGDAPSPVHEARHLCGKGHEACVAPAHLEWGTRSENFQDRMVHGTGFTEERNPNTKLTRDDVRCIRASAGSVKRRVLAEKYGVTVHLVGMIQRRVVWAWLNDEE